MELNPNSSENRENNSSDGVSNTSRSAADSVANAFSNQLAQVQADLAASKAYALSVEEELIKIKSESAAMVEQQSQAIAKIKIESEIKSLAISSGLLDLDCLPLLDSSGITLDQNGNIIGVDSALSDLKTKKPFLFSDNNNNVKTSIAARSTPTPKAKSNTYTPVKDMSESEYKRSLKKLAPSYSRRYN
ncbi:MAG: hypothetical protein ABF876_15480 [Acetobacter aceti]|uniref:phage scaffolding protein n=1 Tax=Acetobacter aceti TaxID=435 RepID=UPI0011EA537D|nr:hypothetical protein [Acetobacter aceti]